MQLTRHVRSCVAAKGRKQLQPTRKTKDIKNDRYLSFVSRKTTYNDQTTTYASGQTLHLALNIPLVRAGHTEK